ncbi:hypothetical protein [Streptomyces sp. NPDC088766]|uniref:5-methylcytosine restriction system specificity protein McrC n=1 Tax=Streptomyces sp. NPDC088766 TaxID=3365893 RepID=UPI00382A5785
MTLDHDSVTGATGTYGRWRLRETAPGGTWQTTVVTRQIADGPTWVQLDVEHLPDDAEAPPVPAKTPRLARHLLEALVNARYQHALHLARAVLDGVSAEHAPGGLCIDGFLFDMNKLFEDFVTVALREAFQTVGPGHTVRLQDPHHLDEAAAIRMKPDFVLYGPDGMPCAVVDAKYKAEKRGAYPDADLYQMLAYCTALGLREGHLVYAKGNAPHAAHRVRHAGIAIHQHALDLDQEPAGLLAEVEELAERLVSTPRV